MPRLVYIDEYIVDTTLNVLRQELNLNAINCLDFLYDAPLSIYPFDDPLFSEEIVHEPKVFNGK